MSEQRTMQFQVESGCPKADRDSGREHYIAIQPFPVWVYIAPWVPGCLHKGYRLTPEGIVELTRKGWTFRNPNANNQAVCEQMGHLIE